MTNDKFFRIPHFPWSLGATSDDKMLSSVDHLLNIPLIFSEKMDGSNCCLTSKEIFARSHNGPPSHPSFDYLKSLHGKIKYNIPKNMSIFGEYCYALHSIFYDLLPEYFMVFGVREDDTNTFLEWELVKWIAQDLNLPTVPILQEKTISSAEELEKEINRFMKEKFSRYGETKEGVVVWKADGFKVDQAALSVAKMVRANHVQTDQHWSQQEVVPNRLARTTKDFSYPILGKISWIDGDEPETDEP